MDSNCKLHKTDKFYIQISFILPGNRNHVIETYCTLTELEFGKHLEKFISKEQQQALSDLEKND